MQVLEFSGRHLSLGEGSQFDWAGFKDAIQRCTGGSISFDKYTQTTIYQQTEEVGAMVSKVVDFLNKALSALIDVAELKAIVKNTFSHLQEIESAQSGFLNFTKSSRKGNSSREYRILFSVPFDSCSSDYFYSLVTTIKTTADIQEKSSWWGLSSSTKKNFDVQIDALRLVVRSNFRAPAPE